VSLDNLYFRADAAFAKPEIYKLLEQEGISYAIRLPANQVLQRRISHLLTRPVGLPRERCDDPSAAFERLCVLPHAPDRSILAMVAALSGKCRLKRQIGRLRASMTGSKAAQTRSGREAQSRKRCSAQLRASSSPRSLAACVGTPSVGLPQRHLGDQPG
jgi:hypothetical protein